MSIMIVVVVPDDATDIHGKLLRRDQVACDIYETSVVGNQRFCDYDDVKVIAIKDDALKEYIEERLPTNYHFNEDDDAEREKSTAS